MNPNIQQKNYSQKQINFIYLISTIFILLLCAVIGLTIGVVTASQEVGRLKEECGISSAESNDETSWWTATHTVSFFASIIGVLTVTLLGLAFRNRKVIRELKSLQLQHDSLLESFKKNTNRR